MPTSFKFIVKVNWPIKSCLLFLATSAYLYLFVRILWRVGDEGTLVYGAQMVAEGALPYRDFFEVMGPGSFYWLALFFKIFGTKWIVARGVLLLTGAVSTILIYWMTRRIYCGIFDTLPAIFYLMLSVPLWPASNHHWDSNLFALTSIAMFLLWQKGGHYWLLFIAGFLSGVTSCFMQQKGLFIFLALIIAICLKERLNRRNFSKTLVSITLLLLGYLCIITILVVFYASNHGLQDLIYSTIL